jgi:anhydro-N-acetylmuramic acid kinase
MNTLKNHSTSLLTPSLEIVTSDALGLDPQLVEGLAFAWLAWAHKEKRPANLPAVTGARGPRILGACYPA